MTRNKQSENAIEKLFPKDKELFDKLLKEGIPQAFPGYHFPLACGTLKWLSEEVCRKLVTLRIMNYLSLANKFVEQYGEEARELIRQLRYEDGYQAGERYAEYAGEEPGTVRNWDILFAGYGMDLPWSNAAIVERTEKRLVLRVVRCGVAETFLAVKPPPDIAKMYCDVDFGTFDALFGKENIKAARPKWIPEGNPYCEYTIEFKE